VVTPTIGQSAPHTFPALSEASSARQLGKECQTITFKPAVKSAVMYSLEAEEKTNGHDFAGIQISIFSFLESAKFVIYHTKELENYFFGSHSVMLLIRLCD